MRALIKFYTDEQRGLCPTECSLSHPVRCAPVDSATRVLLTTDEQPVDKLIIKLGEETRLSHAPAEHSTVWIESRLVKGPPSPIGHRLGIHAWMSRSHRADPHKSERCPIPWPGRLEQEPPH